MSINTAAFDRFTLVHGLVGALLGAMKVSFPTALAAAVGWELVERPLKSQLPALFPHPTQDTFANAAGDASAMLLGWYFASRRRTRR